MYGRSECKMGMTNTEAQTCWSRRNPAELKDYRRCDNAITTVSFLKSKRQLRVCSKYSGAHHINSRNSKFIRYETEYANNKDYLSNHSSDSDLHLFHDTLNEQLLKHIKQYKYQNTSISVVNLRQREAEIIIRVSDNLGHCKTLTFLTLWHYSLSIGEAMLTKQYATENTYLIIIHLLLFIHTWCILL